MEWCKSHDKGLPKPDLLFYIDVSAEDVASRAGFGNEIYEKIDFQKKVQEAYKKLMDQNWQIISGKQEIEDIHKRVIIDVESLIRKFNSNPEPVKELW